MNKGSVSVGPSQKTAFCPNADWGIFVMMADASTVMILVGVPEIDLSLKVGVVNALGAQSSKKSPWYLRAEDLCQEQ